MTHALKKKSLFVALGALLAGQAQGAGFALIEQSASGMGNAFAGAAAVAEDASTIWFNPAGMMNLSGKNQLVVGGHVVMASASFTNSGSTTWPGFPVPLTGKNDDGGTTGFVPNFYWATELEPGIRFGVGVNAPFGMATKYDPDWIGRYHAIESDVRTLNINPSVAFRLSDRVDFGAGFNIQYLDATLSNAINYNVICASGRVSCAGFAPPPFPYSDAIGEIQGDSLAFGWNIGLMIRTGPETRIGLTYRSTVEHDVEGSVRFNAPTRITAVTPPNPPLFVDGPATATVTLPEMFSASIHHRLNDKWTLLGDWTWTRWSRFRELRFSYPNSFQPDSVTPENWKDVSRLSVAANYRMNANWLLRVGAAYDNSPVPNATFRTARMPGNDRTWLSFGLGWKVNREMTVDVGYTHIFVDTTRIENTASSPEGATLRGTYDSSVDILSAQLVWDF